MLAEKNDTGHTIYNRWSPKSWSRDQFDNNQTTRYDHGRDHEQQRPGPSYAAGQDSRYQDTRQSHDQRGYSQER